jgi:restriction endonuclease Mrr
MVTPSYESFMMPALKALQGVDVARLEALAPEVQTSMGLPDEARDEVLPWNRQPVLLARLEAALRDLREAELVRVEGVLGFALTARGRDLVGQAEPKAIDAAFLTKYPEFAAYREEYSKRRGA